MLAAAAAPAIVRSGVLMPVRTIWTPPALRKWVLIENTWKEATLWTAAQWDATQYSMVLQSMRSPRELMSYQGFLVDEKDRTSLIVNRSFARGKTYDFRAMNVEECA